MHNNNFHSDWLPWNKVRHFKPIQRQFSTSILHNTGRQKLGVTHINVSDVWRRRNNPDIPPLFTIAVASNVPMEYPSRNEQNSWFIMCPCFTYLYPWFHNPWKSKISSNLDLTSFLMNWLQVWCVYFLWPLFRIAVASNVFMEYPSCNG